MNYVNNRWISLSPKKTSIKVIVVAACFCFGGKMRCYVSKAEQSSDGGGGQWRPSWSYFDPEVVGFQRVHLALKIPHILLVQRVRNVPGKRHATSCLELLPGGKGPFFKRQPAPAYPPLVIQKRSYDFVPLPSH